tara:strand:- start:33 stop:1055 length:1023 start_codon:yes stop_codon:yes gene_type:complete
MYDNQLQQQQEDDMMRDLYRDQMREDMYDDMRKDSMRDTMYDDIYDDMYKCEYEPEYNYITDRVEMVLKCPTPPPDYEEDIIDPESQTYKVTKVIDGDTFKLSTGEEVRLIGINAPEIGEKCYEEAKEELEELIFGKETILEKDMDDKDQYGRLLRYVYTDYYFEDGSVDEIFINYGMVYLGLAHKYEFGSNKKYSSWFEEAENEAKQNEGCLWASEEVDYIQDKCIYITNFHFNAAGNDNYNLNDEYVTFGNKCSYSIDMTSWTIKDETASHIYTVPSFTFQSSSTFTLFTGTGTNTNSALYWGRTSGDYAAIWNNGGDTLFLRDSNRNLVLSQSYSGY